MRAQLLPRLTRLALAVAGFVPSPSSAFALLISISPLPVGSSLLLAIAAAATNATPSSSLSLLLLLDTSLGPSSTCMIGLNPNLKTTAQ
jgi:hypothetical protein